MVRTRIGVVFAALLALLARSETALRETQQQMETAGAPTLVVPVDLREPLSIPFRPSKKTCQAHFVYSGIGFKMRPIARTTSSQRVVSATSCLRPA